MVGSSQILMDSVWPFELRFHTDFGHTLYYVMHNINAAHNTRFTNKYIYVLL